MSLSTRKLLAFFGSDLALRNPGRVLSKAAKRGYALLAMDAKATALAARHGLSFVTLDDLLDPPTIVRALSNAWDSGLSWFEPARKEFTVHGICLPEVDRLTLHYFWQDAMLALELGTRLRELGYDELEYFGSIISRPQIFSGPSDTLGELWQNVFPGRTRRRMILEPFSPALWKSGIQRMTARLPVFAREPRASGPDHTPAAVKDSILLVCSFQEAHRFGDLVLRLSQALPGKVSVVLAGPHTSLARELSVKWSIPVLPGPALPPVTFLPAVLGNLPLPAKSSPQKGFLTGYQKAVYASTGKHWHKPLKYLRFHFDYYCKYRWPAISRAFGDFWCNLFNAHRPRALIATGIVAPEILLPCLAARQAATPTFSVPHGACGNRPMHRPACDHVLYGLTNQRHSYEKAGVSAGRLLGCRGLVAANEYPMVAHSAFSARDTWKVLVLTDATSEGQTLTKFIGLRAQIRALQTVCNPPSDIAERLEIRIKPHPHFPDLELLRAAGSQAVEKVVPTAADLHALLPHVDLIIAVNYLGSALLHALQAGKPVISYMTDAYTLMQRPDAGVTYYRDGTAVAEDEQELWRLVRLCFTDASQAQGLRERAAVFAQRYLSEGPFPELPELIMDHAGKHSLCEAAANL